MHIRDVLCYPLGVQTQGYITLLYLLWFKPNFSAILQIAMQPCILVRTKEYKVKILLLFRSATLESYIPLGSLHTILRPSESPTLVYCSFRYDWQPIVLKLTFKLI